MAVTAPATKTTIPGRRAALVTGASSGIGREFARLMAERGYDLVLVARRAERLNELAAELEQRHGARSLVIPTDLADPAAPQRLFDAVREAGLILEVLVNNAGLTPDARFLDQSWEVQAGTVQVMAVGPLHLVYLFLPAMLERGSGHVINVASVGAWYTSTPTQTLYGATKAFVLRFTQTLADEYPDRGVTFTAVCPGVTRTEILDLPVSAYATKDVPSVLIDSPRKVAKIGWAAAQKGRNVVLTGPTGKMTFAMLRLLPDAIGGKAIAKRLLQAYDQVGHAG
jgi:uncharacterized protein